MCHWRLCLDLVKMNNNHTMYFFFFNHIVSSPQYNETIRVPGMMRMAL